MLLYTLSNITANSQSRSRSKSSPSENMSYLNSGSYFQNTFNASSITINPDTIENFSQKHSKGTSHTGTSIKKSKRKSSSSKAPSIHSISTLCNGNSSPNNVQDNSQNDKSYHNLSLSTKKSSYNYSIKTFSAKDPSLTGLSQNIKTLFANSYNGTSDTNSYYETFSTLPTNSPKIDSSYDNVLYKDNVTSSSIKTMYGQHKKQNSSISITIPKISNSNTINVSPKNSYSAGGNLIAVSSPQQQRVIKIKKPVHTKQFSVSKSVYSEPMLPINTDNSEILLHDDLDGISYIEPQDQISFNGNSIPSVTIVNTTKVK
ncbi:hypothetical protein BCR36DRAFT_585383 [Piromyces finnis]|uniref:Uncharacterized protein n=1 Tax=Piromyces finnis TaxID=1754191 RepID=A0A1Y1V386_9FUNG|nr:hypothetical protein BCR36DRAFT_585383 [Piromyces finnis]|eukprot:ORX46240.1 hypothetical protein BCR36DRAFT_585383 [Piromyces finnis]